MGTRVMNEYSYPEGKYSSAGRQRELLVEGENVSGYEVPKRDSNQNGESAYLTEGRFQGTQSLVDNIRSQRILTMFLCHNYKR